MGEVGYKTLAIDIETFSDVDLIKCGVYAYADSPAFEILLFAYSFDDEETKIIDLAYKGCYFFNANSRQAPQVVDKQVQPILDQTEVYSGCYGRISVNFYGYNSNGNRGVAAGLGNIQKLKDGEALSSRTNAEDDFEAVEDEDFLG